MIREEKFWRKSEKKYQPIYASEFLSFITKNMSWWCVPFYFILFFLVCTILED